MTRHSVPNGTLVAASVAALFGCAGASTPAAAPSGTTTASVRCLGIETPTPESFRAFPQTVREP